MDKKQLAFFNRVLLNVEDRDIYIKGRHFSFPCLVTLKVAAQLLMRGKCDTIPRAMREALMRVDDIKASRALYLWKNYRNSMLAYTNTLEPEVRNRLRRDLIGNSQDPKDKENREERAYYIAQFINACVERRNELGTLGE